MVSIVSKREKLTREAALGEILPVCRWFHDKGEAQTMDRINSVIAEIEAARTAAVARFASEVNMPVRDFLRHFRVVTEGPSDVGQVSFRVEPRE